ncbi:MAG: hypothetical protein WDZ28_03315 [Simkaniaceae bacterium]
MSISLDYKIQTLTTFSNLNHNNENSKKITLPQEVFEKIIIYVINDLDSVKKISTICKHWYFTLIEVKKYEGHCTQRKFTDFIESTFSNSACSFRFDQFPSLKVLKEVDKRTKKYFKPKHLSSLLNKKNYIQTIINNDEFLDSYNYRYVDQKTEELNNNIIKFFTLDTQFILNQDWMCCSTLSIKKS